MDAAALVSDIEDAVDEWLPRAALRRTNWLYRVDALRPRDYRDMSCVYDAINMCQSYAKQCIIWGNVLRFFRNRIMTEDMSCRIQKIEQIVIQMAHLFYSEGYCHFIEYLQIAYYPSSNRIRSQLIGDRFPPIRCKQIDLLGSNESRNLTGLSVNQLVLLFRHLRIPFNLRDERSRRVFDGEEAFLHYMAYNRLGLTKLQLSLYHFGEDPRRFTYSIRSISEYITQPFIIRSQAIQ